MNDINIQASEKQLKIDLVLTFINITLTRDAIYFKNISKNTSIRDILNSYFLNFITPKRVSNLKITYHKNGSFYNTNVFQCP